MKYALDASMSQKVDRYTTDNIGVPSAVLMERAALSVALKTAELATRTGNSPRVCAVCGSGNNGADGIAAARILTWQGLNVDIKEQNKELNVVTKIDVFINVND